jgi:plasmid stabilization system protein ParE
LIHRLRTDIGEDARMATVGNYAILFRIAGSAVRIERVVYAGRDLPGVFDVSSER